MKSPLFIYFFLYLIGLGLTSCSNEKEFEIVLINDTSFSLDRVKMGCGEGIQFVEAPPQGRSGPFFVTLKSPGLSLSEPLLCVSIQQYSTPVRSYDYSYGNVVSISDLEENRVNFIRVVEQEDPGPSGFKFSIKLQE